MQSVRALFFDLDNTLFDHSRAQAEALLDVLMEFGMGELLAESGFDAVLACFRRHNDRAWRLYAAGRISFDECRTVRFADTLAEFGRPTGNTEALADRFLFHYGRKGCPVDGARDVVVALSEHFSLGIITNGFPGASQRKKVQLMGLGHYFQHIVTPEDAGGAMKPDLRIFLAASEAAGVPPHEIAYVGDDFELDILGASRAGMHTVWFDHNGRSARPQGRLTHSRIVKSLSELVTIFNCRGAQPLFPSR